MPPLQRILLRLQSPRHPAGLFRCASGTAPSRKLTLEEVTSYCKHHGFIYPGSELYGSVGAGYDYGPLGTALKRNVQDAWWKDFISRRAECVGIDTALLMNPKVWEASGHVQQFVDPLSECTNCRKRVRADKAVLAAAGTLADADYAALDLPSRARLASLDLDGLARAIVALRIPCPSCGAAPGHDLAAPKGLQPPRTFNLLFRTNVGPVDAADTKGGGLGSQQQPFAYLRPETAQGVCA